MRRTPLVRRIGIRLPPYDHLHDVPRNSPVFHVDHMQAAGGVCKQTNPALLNYICVDYFTICMYVSTNLYCGLCYHI